MCISVHKIMAWIIVNMGLINYPGQSNSQISKFEVLLFCFEEKKKDDAASIRN